MFSRHNPDHNDDRQLSLARRSPLPPTVEFGLPESATTAIESPKNEIPMALWRAKWWIFFALVLGTIGGFIRVVMTAPVYNASTVVEIMGVNESFMGMNQLDPQAGTGSYSNNAANIQTQSRILMSSAVLSQVMQRVTLEMTPITSIPQDIYSKARLRLGVTSQEPSDIMKQALREAASSTRARGVGATRLLEISCESSSPEVAAAFVNALANEFVSQNSQSRSASTLRTTQWLEGQLEEAKNRIDQAELKLQEFVSKEGMVYVLDQQQLADSKVRQLQTDLSAMQADRIAKQSRWELAKSSPVDSLPEILDDGRMKELRAKLTDLRRERAQYIATLTPAHYKVQRIDAQIAEIEQTLQKEKANLVLRIENEYEASVRKEKMTSSAYFSQSSAMAGQAGKAAQYALLKRDVEMARQVHGGLLQQANQASIVSALPTNNIRVIEQAAVNGIPSRPKPSRDIPFGSTLGAGIAVGLVFLKEMYKAKQLAKVFTSPGHISALLRLPELGAIPSLEKPVVPTAKHFLPFSKPTQEIVLSGDNPKELAAWNQRSSFLADSVRYALTSLLGVPNPPRIVIVTSPGPGEGKTTIAANFAAAAATTGRKTLIIDGDVRRPRLHEVFAVQLDPGLTELLTTEKLEDSILLSRHIRPTSVPGMYLLPAGSLHADESPAEVLFSAKLPGMLSSLKQEFDLILIDTAPALHFPDARLLGKFADGVVLVVRSSVTLRETVVSVANRFHIDRVPVLGTVLNDWNAPDATSAYGYNQYYSTTDPR